MKVLLVVALLFGFTGCTYSQQRDPKNDLVRFMQQLAQNVDLSDYQATLTYLHLNLQSGYPLVEKYTLPNGQLITNYIDYISMWPLPKIPSITIDSYSVTYPGGPAAFGRTKPAGHIMLQTYSWNKTSLPPSPCVSADLMTWTFGEPILKAFATDGGGPVDTWKLPGPTRLQAEVIFGEGNGCGSIIQIDQQK
jgi:hypothetical protein